MFRAIELAKSASALVFPNPYVGAVIVLNDEIIAEGFHAQFGCPHAEVDAVSKVSNKELLRESTIYVTLEPCAHFGKTPPCADLLVHHQFKRVVIGSIDPFAKVNGAGIARLRNAGIDVEVGVLKEACDLLNARFFTFHQQKRPFVTLKWAETKNGFIAPNKQSFGERFKITGGESHVLVHQQRAHEHAILVGKNTALLDDPELTVRLVQGVNPKRFVIDADLELPKYLNIFTDGELTFVFNTKKSGKSGSVEFVLLDEISPESICAKLYEMQILSLYVEGGKHTIQQFIDANLWDKTYRFLGNVDLTEDGLKAPKFSQDVTEYQETQVGEDTLLIYDNSI